MDFGFDVGSLLGGAIGVFGNAIRDKKNREFQEKWNNIQMEREDTAMQRRMADYAAAGINPLMALGSSGAETGNYSVPASTTDYGSLANETISNSILNKSRKQQQQINDERVKQEKDLTSYLSEQHEISLDMGRLQKDVLSTQFKLLERENFMNTVNMLNQFGADYGITLETSSGSDGFYPVVSVPVDKFVTPIGGEPYSYQQIDVSSMPLNQIFRNNLAVSNNSAVMSLNELLLSNKNIKWDTWNRILNSGSQLTGMYQDIMSPFKFTNSTSYGDFYSHGYNENRNYNNSYNESHIWRQY